jgi:spore maturation protein CgeB
MRIVIFCHSLVSDWNHGNAHFLRGIVAELQSRAHEVTVYEPADGWSRRELLADAGASAVARFHHAFPRLTSQLVDLHQLPLDEALDGADVVIVHEWNPHTLVERIGRHKSQGGTYTLLFHDTHHRSVTDVGSMSAYNLEHYDGVLAFGEVIRQRYIALGWSRRAWTWHEAADTRAFRPLPGAVQHQDDLVWIGNWGDDERSAELRAYLIEPVRDLKLSASVYGVRYPAEALRELSGAGIHYGGWLANYDAPLVYARHKTTIHVPRRPYVEALPGIPTIRVFEALACGIPLVSVAWRDAEGLFTPGDDFLVAHTPAEMRTQLRALVHDAALRGALAARGLATIRRRHTCAHRVDELMGILHELGRGTPEETLTI